MTPEQARAHFSEAYDQELSLAQQAQFEDALRADPALQAEFQAFCALLRGAGAPGGLGPEAPVPDLLVGVQHRIRRGTRGRYYGNRRHTRLGWGGIHPLGLGVAFLLLLATLWALLTFRAAQQPPPDAEPTSQGAQDSLPQDGSRDGQALPPGAAPDPSHGTP